MKECWECKRSGPLRLLGTLAFHSWAGSSVVMHLVGRISMGRCAISRYWRVLEHVPDRDHICPWVARCSRELARPVTSNHVVQQSSTYLQWFAPAVCYLTLWPADEALLVTGKILDTLLVVIHKHNERTNSLKGVRSYWLDMVQSKGIAIYEPSGIFIECESNIYECFLH